MNQISSGVGIGGGMGDWLGDAVGGLARAVGDYAIQKKSARSMRRSDTGGGGYRPMMSYAPGAAVGIAGTIGGLLGYTPDGGQSLLGQGIDYLQGQSSGACQKFVSSPATTKSRPLSLISDVNPSTGRMHWWRHVGQPILFSGDVSHCRRVNKLLGKASRKASSRRGR